MHVNTIVYLRPGNTCFVDVPPFTAGCPAMCDNSQRRLGNLAKAFKKLDVSTPVFAALSL